MNAGEPMRHALCLTLLFLLGCGGDSATNAATVTTAEAGDPQFTSIEELESAAIKKDVPYVPTPKETVDEMLRMAKVSGDDIVYDLGSGDGRIVIAAAKQYGARGVGIDIDPTRIAEANENAKTAGVTDRVRFIQGDLFNADIKEATAVTLYLLRSVNMKLRPKLLADLRPGTPVVSHDFDMGEWEPDEHKLVGDDDVYLWIIPANIDGKWNWKGSDGVMRSATIEQEFQKFTGRVTGGGQQSDIRNGRIDGDQISFELDGIRYSGRLTEGKLRGDNWLATR